MSTIKRPLMGTLKIELRTTDGKVIHCEIDCPAPREEFPAIIVVGIDSASSRAFYKITTKQRGTVGFYEECDSIQINGLDL